jgi:murein DD-endopeptidase MepM/ murein hydrolase activator NlpD
MRRKVRTCRAAALAVAGIMIMTLAGSASGTSLLQLTKVRRARLTHAILHVRAHQRADTGELRHRVQRVTSQLENGLGRVSGLEHRRWHATRQLLLHERRIAMSAMRRGQRRSTVRLHDLLSRREAATSWIEEWGLLRFCPVRGPVSIADNFGVTVRIPDVPVHIHQGNDMMAATGTPIVAPFDGTAVASPNVMGGQAVKVYGALGYVYNAHLLAYGELGQVKAGTVIGYVGSTGDAGGPHDHFEWHPDDGAAVDPNPYLSVSCG